MNAKEKGRLKEDELPVEPFNELFVYEQATGVMRWWKERVARNVKWLDEAGSINGHGYRVVMINGTSFLVHRIIWAMAYGAWPDGEIDHINGDKLDNRLDNLRVVTTQENSRNRKKQRNNTSGVTGVRWHKASGKWKAYIMVNGRKIHLGYFDTKAEAVAARKAAELMYDFHPNHGRDSRSHRKSAPRVLH